LLQSTLNGAAAANTAKQAAHTLDVGQASGGGRGEGGGGGGGGGMGSTESSSTSTESFEGMDEGRSSEVAVLLSIVNTLLKLLSNPPTSASQNMSQMQALLGKSWSLIAQVRKSVIKSQKNKSTKT